ncbi:MAG: prephenate dehydrogenase/arogenate dehydrogenase family protein [Acidobacteriota bacterium]
MRDAAVVAGLGLIGGSIALGLDAAGWDEDEAARDLARRRGIRVAGSLEEAVFGAGVVFAAVSTTSAPGLLRVLAALAPVAVLTDAASLKVPVLEAALALPAGIRFVGGHPMAGAATPGIAGARADLFAGRPWLIVPGARSDAASVELVRSFVVRMGAVPVVLGADRHDAAMTWISHLPLAVAGGLALAVVRELGPDAGALAGPGLTDTTRLAGGRPELALELSLSDPARLARAVESVSRELADFARRLEAGERGPIEEFLAEAGRARAAIRPAGGG